MAVDLTLCAKRVTSIINASAKNSDGSKQFTVTVADDRRNADDIAAAVLEAAKLVGEAICSADSHPNRADFITLTTVTHGATLPTHYGTPGRPLIQSYANASFTAGTLRTAAEIESYRANPENIYDAVAHNEEGSMLAGYYDYVGDAIFFTGYAAKAPLATFTDGDIASKLPAASQATIIRLAVGMVKTEGDSGTLDAYGLQGQSDLAQIRAGAETVKPIELAERAA